MVVVLLGSETKLLSTQRSWRYKISNKRTKKFEEGLTYGSLNSIRSVISLISGNNLDKNKNISRFFKKVFMLRPIKLKYNRVWNVDIVLREIEKWFPIDELPLTERLVLLLTLGTAHKT